MGVQITVAETTSKAKAFLVAAPTTLSFRQKMLQSLAQQGQRQYNQRPHNPAPIEQNRTTVRNHFALVNSSINLIPEDSSDGRKLYHFEFEFSNTKPCSVSVYYAVTETLDSGARPTNHEAAFEQKDIIMILRLLRFTADLSNKPKRTTHVFLLLIKRYRRRQCAHEIALSTLIYISYLL